MRIGFRTWSLGEAEGKFQFRAVSCNYTWKLLGVNRAEEWKLLGECKHTIDRRLCKPAGSNTAGFYTYYDAVKATEEYDSRGLLGACMCWGRLRGKDGEGLFRSEYAQILAVTEPNWVLYPKPQRPVMSQPLSSRLWMVAVNNERHKVLNSVESFRSYVEALSRVLGFDAGALKMDEIYAKYKAGRMAVEDDYTAYQREVMTWEASIREWDREHSERFRAQMPFPVFSTIPALVEYAKKFGDLGPPDRNQLGGTDNKRWETLD